MVLVAVPATGIVRLIAYPHSIAPLHQVYEPEEVGIEPTLGGLEMDEFYNGLGIAVGVFVGVVGGTGVALVTQWVSQKRSESQQVSNLRFELDLNVKKIDGWLEEITRYRNAVNAQNLNTYFGYFDLSRFLMVTSNNLLYSGLLFKHLDYEDIGKLQVISSELSASGQSVLNNAIEQFKVNFDQAKAAENVNFWEGKFREHKQTLQRILQKLP